MRAKVEVIQDAVPLEVPQYLHLLTGHYDVRGARYGARRLRGTADWLLIATLAGRGRFGSGPQPVIAEERDLMLIRPGTPHDYGIAPGAERWELLWAHFHPRPHWHDWLLWPERAPGLMHLRLTAERDWREARACFRGTHTSATGATPFAQELAMNRLEALLLCCQGVLQQDRGAALDPRIQSVVQRISGNLSEPLNIHALADAVALSPSRLSHLFREQVGVSPMQYLDQQRIQRSKQLLERTSSSISQIASDVGFDPIYFSLRFKQHTGLSPRAYRQRATPASIPDRSAGR